MLRTFQFRLRPNATQRAALEHAVNCYPAPRIELWPQPKPGETIAIRFWSNLPMPPSDGCDDGITDWKEQYRSDFGEATMMDYPDLSWEQRYKLKWLDALTE